MSIHAEAATHGLTIDIDVMTCPLAVALWLIEEGKLVPWPTLAAADIEIDALRVRQNDIAGWSGKSVHADKVLGLKATGPLASALVGIRDRWGRNHQAATIEP